MKAAAGENALSPLCTLNDAPDGIAVAAARPASSRYRRRGEHVGCCAPLSQGVRCSGA